MSPGLPFDDCSRVGQRPIQGRFACNKQTLVGNEDGHEPRRNKAKGIHWIITGKH